MKQYEVIKKYYYGAIIADLSPMTIEELRDLAMDYLGDVFQSVAEVDEDMKCIQERGEELWFCNDEVEIIIKEIEE